jgi:metallo-beta-lactamase family protein
MKIEFHGADRGVTGSGHLIECAGTRALIDCGLYQGGRELEEENAQAFGFDPSTAQS